MRSRERVPFRKAVSILLTGFVCGFCLVWAVMDGIDRGFSATTLKYGAGAILALFGAFFVYRRM